MRMQQMVEETKLSRAHLLARDTDPSLLYPERRIQVPVDHFQNDTLYEPHSNETFALRYWFDAQYYKPGGPVITLQSGETSGVGRLPFLQKGIVSQLAQATNGVGVILEHRYYGESLPTKSFSTEDLRFLTTEQALADQAYFSQNIVFPGLEDIDLTSKSAPHIAYGGSYAGAFVAFLRLVYPDVIWGSISSSGVPKAIYDYWEYYAPVAEYGPPDCIDTQQTLIDIIDNVIVRSNSTELINEIKSVFGLSNLTHLDDFANTVSTGISGWQSLNWDPAISSNSFYAYCDTITATTVQTNSTAPLRGRVSALVEAAGYAPEPNTVTSMLNLIGYVSSSVTSCARRNQTQDQCFSSYDPESYAADDLDQSWRLWPYQYCTEWGYLQTGSGVPADQKPVLSRLIDLPFSELICNYAFNRTAPPDTDRINKYGGYDISYPRLAFVDGEVDPWRPAGVHAFDQGAKERESTTSEPFILIPDAVHHWDENGVFPNQTNSTFPPQSIKDVQAEEARFVKAWLQEWQEYKLNFG
ncbi:extracellular serine carboxypeptidase-like protein 1 [Elsinoe australis]|uniref:Extracellular serine carboxypeptidase-like protein 1 n=1 Tax=Elsinoe australis TaxID=40998 RepID=A0A4U7B9P0_9PEZI|nr:extracellular serine carboxypeptidase-like protein 1 [Elsinoe australis]